MADFVFLFTIIRKYLHISLESSTFAVDFGKIEH